MDTLQKKINDYNLLKENQNNIKNSIINCINSINQFNKNIGNDFQIELLNINFDIKKIDLVKYIDLKIVKNDFGYNYYTLYNKIMNKYYNKNDLILEKLNDLYLWIDKSSI